MAWIFYAIIIVVFTILNAGNLTNFMAITELNIKPDLMTVIMACLISYSSSKDAIGIAFFTGFMADISGTSIGPCMLAYGIVGSIYSSLRNVMEFGRIRYQALIIFAITFLVLSISEPLTMWKTADTMPRIFLRILVTSIYSAIVGPAIWQLAAFIRKFFGMPYRQDSRRF